MTSYLYIFSTFFYSTLYLWLLIWLCLSPVVFRNLIHLISLSLNFPTYKMRMLNQIIPKVPCTAVVPGVWWEISRAVLIHGSFQQSINRAASWACNLFSHTGSLHIEDLVWFNALLSFFRNSYFFHKGPYIVIFHWPPQIVHLVQSINLDNIKSFW